MPGKRCLTPVSERRARDSRSEAAERSDAVQMPAATGMPAVGDALAGGAGSGKTSAAGIAGGGCLGHLRRVYSLFGKISTGRVVSPVALGNLG